MFLFTGSHISLYPTLNFVVYVPSQKHTPLYMRTKEGKIYFWFDTFSGNRPKRVTSSAVKCQNNFFTGKQSRSNAFLSPQWGGIMIYNMYRTASENDTSPQRIAVDMKPVMNTFLSQLKLLLGVTPVVSIQLKLGSI